MEDKSRRVPTGASRPGADGRKQGRENDRGRRVGTLLRNSTPDPFMMTPCEIPPFPLSAIGVHSCVDTKG
jgi:hypothetical protein